MRRPFVILTISFISGIFFSRTCAEQELQSLLLFTLLSAALLLISILFRKSTYIFIACFSLLSFCLGASYYLLTIKSSDFHVSQLPPYDKLVEISGTVIKPADFFKKTSPQNFVLYTDAIKEAYVAHLAAQAAELGGE